MTTDSYHTIGARQDRMKMFRLMEELNGNLDRIILALERMVAAQQAMNDIQDGMLVFLKENM